MKISVKIAGLDWKAPVAVAAGIVNSGKEYGIYTDLNVIGALTTKGVSPVEWLGDPVPRMTEAYGGMVSSVGVHNLGVEGFIKNDSAYLQKLDTNIIVNVVGHEIKDYVKVAEALSSQDSIDMLELSLVPLNPRPDGFYPDFGKSTKITEKLIKEVRKVTDKPIIVKLSPNNISNVTEISRAAEFSGVDALSMINVVQGTRIEVFKRKPGVGNKIGGLSGPAIRPIGVGCVYQCSKAVKIPIIGIGGITTSEDALEYIMAGATAVAVGTAHFTRPRVTMEIIEGLKQFMKDNKVDDINELVGVSE